MKSSLFKICLITTIVLVMVGCESLTLQEQETNTEPQIKEIKAEPQKQESKAKQKKQGTKAEPKKQPSSITENGVTIHPYQLDEIKRKNINQATQKLDDGQNISAHQNLLKQVKAKLEAKQYNDAEKLAIQAQRIAPQSAENYLYLSFIALKRNNVKNAESFARRGLSYAQNNVTKRQLWMIMQSIAKQTNNSKLALEAQTALKTL